MTVVRIFNDSDQEDENTTWTLDDVTEYVNQFLVYELQIKDLQDSKREWSADFLKRKSIPKKELTQAIRVAKQDMDMDVVNEIYDNISDMFVD